MDRRGGPRLPVRHHPGTSVPEHVTCHPQNNPEIQFKKPGTGHEFFLFTAPEIKKPAMLRCASMAGFSKKRSIGGSPAQYPGFC